MADCSAELLPDEQLAWLTTLPEPIHLLISQIAELEGGCWLVGGAVREALLGSVPVDWDLTTTIHPQRLLQHLRDMPEESVRVIPTGIRFGTITVIWSGLKMEVTTLRSESSFADGRRPEIVDFGDSLGIDLQRRDFTVNSMAIDIQRGLLHDPNQGLLDLRARLIRAVGNPRRRIAEDGLRLLRAYRFIDRGEQGLWTLEHELCNALQSEQTMLAKVAAERKWSELQRILCGRHAGQVLSLMASHRVLDLLVGESFLDDEGGISAQGNPHLSGDVPPAMRLALMFAQRARESLARAAQMLILSKKQRSLALLSHRLLGTPPSHNDRGMMRLWRQVVGDFHQHQLLLESAWAEAGDGDLSDLREQMAELPALRAGSLPLAGGEWIMESTGLGKGPRLGRLKEWLHRIQIERDLFEMEDMEDVLATLHWQHTDHETWPRLDWPA